MTDTSEQDVTLTITTSMAKALWHHLQSYVYNLDTEHKEYGPLSVVEMRLYEAMKRAGS